VKLSLKPHHLKRYKDIAVALGLLLFGDNTGIAQERSSWVPTIPLTTNEQAEVRQKLDAFENGNISVDDLTKDKEKCDELIKYYLSHTNKFSIKAKLPISRCYALKGVYPDAARFAQEYVNVYSNDWRGWKILGGSSFFMKSFDKSVQAYSNAVRLGDENSYEPLALAAIKGDRMYIIGGIIPELMSLKSAKQTPEDNRVHLISILLFYSVKTNQKDVFIKTLEGVDMRTILQDNDVRLDVTSGCQLFKGKDIDNIRQESAVATGGSSSSNNTNGLPP
jgi:tetratricopeptide (TPR) repeat protein